jgi:competence protein ComEC
MAKKSTKAKAFGLSILSLILGVIIGAGGNFGVTTATYNEETNTKVNQEIVKPAQATSGIIHQDFQIHFLELGNKYAGDSTYIKAGDLDILIDAGSRADSADTIQNYINQYCDDGKLEYVIATHAHQDHIAALVGNSSKTYDGGRDGILYRYTIDNLIYFSQTNNESSRLVQNFYSTVDYLKTKGTNCLTADNACNETPKYALTDDVTMEILWNKYYFEKSSDENDHSVISLFTYKHDEGDLHSFLFTGDLEKSGEEAFVDYYTNTKPNVLPKSVDLFKGGHHGSKTSSNDVLLDLVDPQMCCVCCCAGSTEYTVNRVNTFPTQQFIDRIAKHTDAVYITSMWDEETETFKSMNGNIIVSCSKEGTAIASTNNLTKLKDTEWFSHTVYVNSKDQIVSKGTSGAKGVPCRTLPEQWK